MEHLSAPKKIADFVMSAIVQSDYVFFKKGMVSKNERFIK